MDEYTQSIADKLKEKGEFLNIVAHELRAPLQPIIGYTDRLMQQKETTDAQKAELAIILKNAQQLLRLIQDVIDMNKMETGDMKYTKEQIDVQQLLDDVYQSFKPSAEAKHVAFSFTHATNVIQYFGDPMRLTQVVANLVTNAIKFTDSGVVNMKIDENPSEIIITIADTGMGIAPEHMPKLFTKFFQVDPSRGKSEGSSGLGLAIARTIIDAHGGAIEVTSERGVGSTFTIHLPKNTSGKAS